MDTQLFDILRCPVTHSPLRREGDVLVSVTGGLRYPIRDGVPVLLPSEAHGPQGVQNAKNVETEGEADLGNC